MNPPFDPAAYGPVVQALLTPDRLPDLGPGVPNLAVRPTLQSLTLERLFDGRQITDRDMASCCLAALWLHHDFLDESHAIAQDIHTPTGSYWHAILHRREPDPSNSKYWFRRVGTHPIFLALAEGAARLGYGNAKNPWNPGGFVDACEAERGTESALETVLKRVQKLEWELLFAWCWKQASGA